LAAFVLKLLKDSFQIHLLAITKYERSVLHILGRGNGPGSKLADIVLQTLDMTRSNRSYFSTGVAFKPIIGEQQEEVSRITRVNKVDKRIANIGPVMDIHWHIKEIIFALETFEIDLLEQARLGILVRDVPQHQRSDGLITIGVKNLFQISLLWNVGGMVWAKCFAIAT